MLTDCASQYEMKGVNDIPKSFQKLINEMQNVKKNKKQPVKNLSLAPLDVKTIQKNPKNPATIKKKKKPKKLRPLDVDFDNDDESNLPKDSGVQVLNQTNITDFMNTVKRNLFNCYAEKSSKQMKKYDEVPNENNEILSSDDDQLFYSHQNPTTDFKKPAFSVSAFQNPDYLSYLSSRNNDINSTSEKHDGRNITEGGKNSNRDQTTEVINWKTFNEISTDVDCDIPIERKKNITPSTFYSYNKPNVKPRSKVAENIDQTGFDPSLTKNQNNDISRKKGSKDVTKNWVAMLKDDQEKMKNLLIQVKSMNDTITKSTQDISKFFMNRNK